LLDIGLGAPHPRDRSRSVVSAARALNRGRKPSAALLTAPAATLSRTTHVIKRHHQATHRQGLRLHRDARRHRILLPQLCVHQHPVRLAARGRRSHIHHRPGPEGSPRRERSPGVTARDLFPDGREAIGVKSFLPVPPSPFSRSRQGGSRTRVRITPAAPRNAYAIQPFRASIVDAAAKPRRGAQPCSNRNGAATTWALSCNQIPLRAEARQVTSSVDSRTQHQMNLVDRACRQAEKMAEEQ